HHDARRVPTRPHRHPGPPPRGAAPRTGAPGHDRGEVPRRDQPARLPRGAAMLIGGVAIATGGDEVDDMRMLAGLGIGILGGFISVAGILLGSVFIISPLVRAVGAL